MTDPIFKFSDFVKASEARPAPDPQAQEIPIPAPEPEPQPTPPEPEQPKAAEQFGPPTLADLKAERARLLEHLADLDEDEYDLEREAAAAKMGGIRLSSLDKLVEKIRQTRADAEGARVAAAAAVQQQRRDVTSRPRHHRTTPPKSPP